MFKKFQCFLYLIVLSAMMILLSSCAANKVELSPAAQLDQEINRWQSFHMEGMAEFQSSAFAVRKYFIFQKYSHSMQFDLVNAGLLGAEPAPLVSIKVDSLITIDSPYQDLIQTMLNRFGMKQLDISKYLDFQTLFKYKKPEILSSGKTTIGTFEFRFNKMMQISQIISKDEKENITINYRKSEPSLIVADIKKLAKIRMQVEQFVNTSCCDTLMNLPQNKSESEGK